MIGLPCTLAALLPLAAGDPAPPSTADATKPAPVIVIMGGDTPAPYISSVSSGPHTFYAGHADLIAKAAPFMISPGQIVLPKTPPQPIALSPLAACDEAPGTATVCIGDKLLRAERIAIVAGAPAAVVPVPPPNPPALAPPEPVTPSPSAAAMPAVVAGPPTCTDQEVIRAAHVSLTTAPAGDEAPITLLIEDQPLREVMDALREATGRNIVLDPRALAERGVTPDTRVSASTKGVRLEIALKTMLKPLGLECRRERDYLLVTTAPREGITTQTYYVADLIGGKPTAAEFNAFAEAIREIVAPGTWKPVIDDGPVAAAGQVGSITPFFLNVSVIVRHDEAVHRQVQALLRTLRDVQEKGIPATEARQEVRPVE